MLTLYLLIIAGLSLQYKFEPMNIRYSHKIGDVNCEGHVNEDGDFVIDISTLPKWDGSARLTTGPFIFPLVSARHGERVYEFRSGKLVPMIFDSERGLIPEVGSDIILFKDYIYHPYSRRIYNLPGRFVYAPNVNATRYK